MSQLFHLIASGMVWRKVEDNIHKMVPRMLYEGIVRKSRGLVMCGVVPPLSHTLHGVHRTTKYYIYHTVQTLLRYICHFLW
jgi:hypothetical protein